MDREASDESLIFGRRPVLEALGADQPIQRLYFQKGIQGGSVQELFDLVKQQRLPFDLKEKVFLDQLAAGGNHQGVIAMRAAGAYTDYLALLRELEPSSAFLVALDHVQDPQNLGAIIRSACAVGADGIVLPKRGAAGLSGGAAKAAAGTAEILPVCRVGNLVQSLQKARKAGLWIVGLDPRADTPFTEADYRDGCAIVVGSEATGLRRLVRETCDLLVTIPTTDRVESLNASVAGALVLYEVFRQRRRKPA
jgi:23S rRNA (guanosine2251-2'-O)-methyltransferase